MLRSRSASPTYDQNYSVEHQHHSRSDECQGTKRVRRLFHDPERITEMDKIFSEYDWQTNTYSPTLRDKPGCRRSSSEPPTSSFRSIIETKEPRSLSPSVPRSPSKGQPDEALISSHLLSTSPLSQSSDSSSRHHSSWPISRASSQSALQQFISCSSETDGSAKTPCRHPRRHATHQVGGLYCCCSNAASVRNNSARLMLSARQFTASDDAAIIDEFNGKERNRKRTFSSISSRRYSRDSCTDYDVEDFRRFISKSRRKKPRADENTSDIYEVEFEDDDNNEIENEKKHSKESRFSVIVSAIHYQYVSVGLSFQLALYRAERKVAKKLSDKRKIF